MILRTITMKFPSRKCIPGRTHPENFLSIYLASRRLRKSRGISKKQFIMKNKEKKITKISNKRENDDGRGRRLEVSKALKNLGKCNKHFPPNRLALVAKTENSNLALTHAARMLSTLTLISTSIQSIRKALKDSNIRAEENKT